MFEHTVHSVKPFASLCRLKNPTHQAQILWGAAEGFGYCAKPHGLKAWLSMVSVLSLLQFALSELPMFEKFKKELFHQT